MLTNDHIVRIIRESALLLEFEVDANALQFVEINNRNYAEDEFSEFKRDLLEAGSKVKILFLEYLQSQQDFKNFLKEDNYVLAFKKSGEGKLPVIIQSKKNKLNFYSIGDNKQYSEFDEIDWYTNSNGEINYYVVFPYKNLVSDDADTEGEDVGPVRRFFRLLSTEKKEIFYILFYAFLVGLIGLVLPLGIQTTVELISGGVFFSSVYLMIALVIVGVLLAGVLQIVQISLVEHLQRRIFAKAAIEFAFRIPRIKVESIFQSHAPELVNRFFDILTLQKGMPKLFTDLSAGVIQILFGLLLLSLYHPFFVFFKGKSELPASLKELIARAISSNQWTILYLYFDSLRDESKPIGPVK